MRSSCSVSGCEAAQATLGFCRSHYRRFKRHGDPLAGGASRSRNTDICTVEGCEKPARTKSLCSAHYRRLWRHGDPTAGRTEVGEPERYIREVALTHGGGDCLIWPYSRKTDGAAQINLGGRSVIVARMVCEEVNGPPPTPAHQAAHSCGKGHLGCITPQHLRWATQVENEADKLIHGTHNRYRYAAIRQARMSSHG